MATGPVDLDALARLQAERDDLARRCGAAESQVRELTEQLESARAELAARDREATTISLFDGQPGDVSITGDGSDPRVLSMILGATAVVSGMVTLLAIINGNLFTLFGLIMVAITGALAWGAASTRVVPVEVSVARGVVYIDQGETSHRFDVRRPDTRLEVVGTPGDTEWSVRFLRRHMDPFVVDATMVDPHDFMARLREHRPDL